MSNAAKSMLVFGIYMVVTGIGFVAIPNTLLAVFGLPPTNEPWIRVMGVLMLGLGYYYSEAGRNEVEPLFRWSIYARAAVAVVFTIFVVLGLAEPTLILFGTIDLLGAVWTGLALRASQAE